MQRRSILKAASAVFGISMLAAPLIGQAQAKPLVEVWKTPTCGCCHNWISHLEANGFQVKAHDVSDAEKSRKRAALGMPEQLGSCHTALVNGYVLEGHVPAKEIRRMLKERPRAVGITVPGMPLGSPGMDGPAYGGRTMPYNVLLVQRDGNASVYQAYR